ncbi:18340_t:CDS:1, partial [Acaulospora morrowiae]
MTIKFSNGDLCFGYDDLTINFRERSYEFSRYFFDPEIGYLLKSDIVECEIFQVLES